MRKRVVASGVLLSVTCALASVVSCNSGNDQAPDASDDDSSVANGLTCSQLVFCDQSCTTNDCTNGCYAEATGVAQGLFNVFSDCVSAQCPNHDSTCESNAGSGACGGDLAQCFSDTFVGPPDPDGGAVVVPDSGATYNCGELNTCLANCPTDAGAGCATTCNDHATPQAEALEAALQSCLAIACPSTNGGPCATPGPACAGCIEQVTLAQPNTCAAPYVACNSDTSNLGDGGPATPTVLVNGPALSTILTGLDQAASTIVVNNNWLYFTQVVTGGPVYRLWIGAGSNQVDGGLAFGDGGIASADGGALLESVGPPQPTPVALAVDANNVYVWSVGTFALNSSVNNKDGTVVQIPLNGTTPTTLATGLEVFYDSAYLNAIAVDSQYVYWVAGASGSDGTIMREPIGGGTATAIFTGQNLPEGVATDGTNVYWADWGTFDAQGRSNNDGTVWQGSINGGSAIQLASNQPGPATIAVDGQTVYWANLGQLGTDNFPALNSGSVMKVAVGGGTPTTIASSQAVPVSLIVANGTVYWSDYGLSAPGLVMSIPTDGGTGVVPLVDGLNDPAALVFSAGTLYWTIANSSSTSGAIMSLGPL